MINNHDFNIEIETQKDIERQKVKTERDNFFRKVFKEVLSRLGVKNDDRFIIHRVDNRDVDVLFYKYIGYLASGRRSQSESLELALLFAVDKWKLSCSPELLDSVSKRAIRALDNGPFRLTKEIIDLFHERSLVFCESETMYHF